MANVRILIEQEGVFFIGQCLEHDLCVQGDDLNDVRRRMLLQLEHFSDRLGGLEAVGPAPEEFFAVWNSGNEPPLRMTLKLHNNSELEAEFRIHAVAA